MSMNLHCEEVDLWQTPTYITYMCFSNEDGGWQGILYRYTQWVKSCANGPFKSSYDADIALQNVKEHLNKFKGKKQLTFSIV